VSLSLDVGQAFYGSFPGVLPAQQLAIAPIGRGDDALILSGTGSGKTEAAVAPLVDRYRDVARRSTGCCLLYVTPTRALANDLLRRLQPPLERLGLTIGIRHGDHNDLSRRRKPHLLITTPESLDLLLTRRTRALADVHAVVLDEVHLTYNSQRGFQLAVLLERLEGFAGRPLQMVGLSATVADPADIWAFFRPGREAVTVRDQRVKPLDYHLRHLTGAAELIELVTRAASAARVKILLFANSRKECDRLGAELRGQTRLGDHVFVHHSSLDRETRLAVERAFQELPSALCIATSTLELGIDIGDVDLIVLYGHPGGWESFLQRAGRGNRRSDKTNVLCLLPPDHPAPFVGALAFEALVAQVRAGRLERARPLDIIGAVGQQILSILLEREGAYRSVTELATLFSAWPHLQRPVVEQILTQLAKDQNIRRHPVQHRYGAGPGLHLLHRLGLIWSNFPSRSREVKMTWAGREVGLVPAHNLLQLKPGITVSFAGRDWQVQRLLPDEIQVEPGKRAAEVEITYGGGAIGLDPTTLEEMLRLLDQPEAVPAMDTDLCRWYVATVERVRRYAGSDRVALARDDTGYCYFTFAGQVVNHVVALWSGQSAYEAADVVLRTEQAVDFADLPTDPSAARRLAATVLRVPGDLSIFQSALPPDLLEHELGDLWLKTPVFARTLARLRSARIVEAPLEEVAELWG